MNRQKGEIYAMIIAGIFLAIFVVISFLKDGTGDAGDSIEHYLISRFAIIHPELFLHHWGKPVFTLLSSPFSQFGFVGIKIFNSGVAALSGFFVYKTASRLRLPFSLLAFFFLFCAPVYFKYIFSGMTEHLLGLALVFAIYLAVNKQLIPSLIIVSFMPFMRSEGLIFIVVFTFYLLVIKKYRFVPLLLTGHIIYGIIGFFHYHDFLWVIRRIPYLTLDSWYGSGNLTDFVTKLYYVIGLPLYIMLVIGLLWIFYSFLSKKVRSTSAFYREELLLVYGSFIAFFVAHSLFWALGIFNSMGLGRVLNSVIPLTALIGMRGLGWIGSSRYPVLNRSLAAAAVLFIIVFNFIENPASLKWHRDLERSTDQKLIDAVVPDYRDPDSKTCYLYSHPHISLQLGIDPFDSTRRRKIFAIHQQEEIPRPALIIWDSWFSPVEEGFTLEMLGSYDFLKLLSIETSGEDPSKKIAIFAVKEVAAQ